MFSPSDARSDAFAGCAPPCTRARGFTLLELLAALTIVATLSAIAIPLYTQYSERTFRTVAQGDLLTCSQALERNAALSFSFENTADTDDDGAGDADEGPVASDICDLDSVETDRYDINIVADVAGFVLTATPTDEGPMAEDGFISIDNQGNKIWDENNDDVVQDEEENWYED